MGKDKKSNWFELILSIGSCLVPLLFIFICYFIYDKISPGVGDNALDEYTQNALNIILEASNSLASITILLLGGVWGLIFAQKERILVRGLLRLLPLIGGSIAMAFSYVCYRKALGKYAEILFMAKTCDLGSPIIQFWPNFQIIFFALGFLIFVVFLIATFIKGGKSCK